MTRAAPSVTTRAALALGLVLLAGCRPYRFADRPITWHDDDDRPIPLFTRQQPGLVWLGLRDAFFAPLERGLAVDYGREARNLNALDEVPDSSWFADPRRFDADGRPLVRPRRLSEAELTLGAHAGEAPPEPPFVVRSAKQGGSAAGFVVEDARGRKFLLKLDPERRAGLVTSTELVSTRLLWASGYRVPKETLVALRPGDLRPAPDGRPGGKPDPKLDERALSAALAKAGRNPDGTVRALASRWIDGKIIGWFSYLGRDKHDPNDRVPHEDRRELRGFGVLASWINFLDAFDNNTLDTYVGEPGRGHVVHYLQDVGGSFGSYAGADKEYWMGHEGYLSAGHMGIGLFTFGLRPRVWERAREERQQLLEAWPELGPFSAERFRPRDWHPTLDNPAFVRQTARDRYWGARRVLAFDAAELRAAIAAGDYRPEAAARLFSILWERRARIGQAFLRGVAALDHFHLDGARLCFDDLWPAYQLGGPSTLEARLDPPEPRAPLSIVPTGPSESCVPLPPREGYRVVALRLRRPGERHFGPTVRVHLLERSGARRLLGLER